MTKLLITLAICATAIFVQDMYRIYTAVYVDGSFIKYAHPSLEFTDFNWQVQQDEAGNPFVYAPAWEFFWLSMEDMPFLLFLDWEGEPTPRATGGSGISAMPLIMPDHHITARGNFVQLFRVLVDGEELTHPANTLVELPTPTREGYGFKGWESLIPMQENTFAMPRGTEAGQIVGEIVSTWASVGSQNSNPPVTQPQRPPTTPPSIPSDAPEDNISSDSDYYYIGYDETSAPIAPRQERRATPTHPTRDIRTPQPIAHVAPTLVLSTNQNYCPVEFLVARGIMQSSSIDHSAPYQTMSQAVFVHALMNAHHIAGGAVFSNVNNEFASEWYGQAVNWALNLNLTNIDNFAPYDIITTEEVVAILTHYLSLAGSVANEIYLPQPSPTPLTRAEVAYIIVQFFGF
ncbi:MAG: InlB B-repeat-containing protein [Defluviitaleaceae bacterium]|nr:InlB B-repeat-containing protein [Defluviitaleaceae bacterium]